MLLNSWLALKAAQCILHLQKLKLTRFFQPCVCLTKGIATTREPLFLFRLTKQDNTHALVFRQYNEELVSKICGGFLLDCNNSVTVLLHSNEMRTFKIQFNE